MTRKALQHEGFTSNQILRPVTMAILTLFLRRGRAGRIFSTGSALDAFVKGYAQQAPYRKRRTSKRMCWNRTEVLQDSSRPDLAPEPSGGPFNMH